MIISHHILVVVVVMLQIFSYFVKNAIEANQIAAIVKYIIRKLELIAVKVMQQSPNHLNRLILQLQSLPLLRDNALE